MTIHGAISIFYKNTSPRTFLVVENAETRNITFVSGAQEPQDESIEDTALREIREELGITVGISQLMKTTVKHKFIFSSKKVERTGKRGEYTVFLIDASKLHIETHTKDLQQVNWMTEEEVLQHLTFEDLKDVFRKAISS
jgi:8-oxo-dGTP pyrophosphatase MutT (NUDIX family)